MTGSVRGVDGGVMRNAAIALACLLGAAAATQAVAGGPLPGSPPAPPEEPRLFAPPGRPRAEPMRPPRGRVCFSQAETRDKIIQRRLADPLGAMRAGRAEGEALRTRLCRWRQDELVYEVYVLRRDGRIMRLYMDAQNGKVVGAPEPPERK